MAIAYKCDRCGAFYDRNAAGKKITTRRYDAISAQREHDDLCPKCADELMEWFEFAENNHTQGYWEPTDDGMYHCSRCGNECDIDMFGKPILNSFCGYCGSKMG